MLGQLCSWPFLPANIFIVDYKDLLCVCVKAKFTPQALKSFLLLLFLLAERAIMQGRKLSMTFWRELTNVSFPIHAELSSTETFAPGCICGDKLPGRSEWK